MSIVGVVIFLANLLAYGVLTGLLLAAGAYAYLGYTVVRVMRRGGMSQQRGYAALAALAYLLIVSVVLVTR